MFVSRVCDTLCTSFLVPLSSLFRNCYQSAAGCRARSLSLSISSLSAFLTAYNISLLPSAMDFLTSSDGVGSMVLSSILSSLAMWQGRHQHVVETDLSNKLHNAEIEKATLLHDQGMETSKSNFEKEVSVTKEFFSQSTQNGRCYYINENSVELAQHFQQLNANLISGNRESERDMHARRNEQFQNIILSATVMFAALCSVIIQGIIPQNSSHGSQLALATFAGLGFASFFTCIILALKLVAGMTNYMYQRSLVYNKKLHEMISQTKDLINKLNEHTAIFNRDFTTVRFNEKDMTPDNAEAFRQKLMDHVDKIHKLMKDREVINDQLYTLQANVQEVEFQGRRCAGIAVSAVNNVPELRVGISTHLV